MKRELIFWALAVAFFGYLFLLIRILAEVRVRLP